MALQKIRLGTNEDGTPLYHYHHPDGHVVITPTDMSGLVTLADGSQVDVTDRVIAADSPEHALAIHDAIAARLAPVDDAPVSTKKKG